MDHLGPAGANDGGRGLLAGPRCRRRPQDPGLHRLGHALRGPILPFTLDGPRIVWRPEPAIAVEPIEASRAPELALAAAWLRDQLTPGPAPAADLTSRARRDGITPITLRRAKTLLNVRYERRDFAPGPDNPWLWSLPDHPISSSPSAPEPPPKALIAA